MDLFRYVAESARRVGEARVVADSLRHDNTLHRVAMKAVFVLEDCHEAFLRLQDAEAARHPVILP